VSTRLPSDLSFHHDVGTDIGLLPNITSGHESSSFVEGTRARPSTAPKETAALKLDVVEHRREHGGADALASFVLGRRHPSKPPRGCIGPSPRSCLPQYNGSTDHDPVVDCGEMSFLRVVRIGRECVSRFVRTQHSVPQWKGLCGRHASDG
jgi:hypothetical protein